LDSNKNIISLRKNNSKSKININTNGLKTEEKYKLKKEDFLNKLNSSNSFRSNNYSFSSSLTSDNDENINENDQDTYPEILHTYNKSENFTEFSNKERKISQECKYSNSINSTVPSTIYKSDSIISIPMRFKKESKDILNRRVFFKYLLF